jgi:replicative DNA helicase
MAFDLDFERDILSQAARDSSYRESAKRLLNEHTFSDARHGWLWNVMATLSPGDRLTGGLVVARAKLEVKDEEKRDEHMRVALQVLKREPSAAGASLAALRDFVKFKAMSGGMEKAIKLLDAGKINEAEAELTKATKTHGGVEYQSEDWAEGFEARMARRKWLAEHPEERLCVPTHIEGLDKVLDGGIEAGELGLIVGTTGRGKSHFAVHVGYWGAVAGYTTMAVTTEMNKVQYSLRYDAKLLAIASQKLKRHDLDSGELRAIADKMERVKSRLLKRLRIVHTPPRGANTKTIEQAMDDMANEGRPVQLLVVDCADHIKAAERNKEHRIDVANSYWELKSLADERGIPVWATAQASKEAIGKIASAENTSDSYDKARIADIIFTLNQTKAEERDGFMKGFLAKHRAGRGKVVVPMKVELAYSHFEQSDEAHAEADEEEDDGT